MSMAYLVNDVSAKRAQIWLVTAVSSINYQSEVSNLIIDDGLCNSLFLYFSLFDV